MDVAREQQQTYVFVTVLEFMFNISTSKEVSSSEITIKKGPRHFCIMNGLQLLETWVEKGAPFTLSI